MFKKNYLFKQKKYHFILFVKFTLNYSGIDSFFHLTHHPEGKHQFEIQPGH